METGDWNDGMNMVGVRGKGESVWLGWFLHAVLSEWATLAAARGEGKRAERWREHVGALKTSLERAAWDGEWYRRAYFDNGTPLGSAGNDACPIDSIAQSWSVISAAADPARPGAGHGGRRRAPRASRRRPRAIVHAAVRRDGAGARLRQGLRPPGPRERRTVHARGGVVGAFAMLGDGDGPASCSRC
jgi:cyclic beta-1,2-glucan glucanotransferase